MAKTKELTTHNHKTTRIKQIFAQTACKYVNNVIFCQQDTSYTTIESKVISHVCCNESRIIVLLLIIVARLLFFRAKNGPRGSRPNETGTVRYLRRAVAVERRWGADLTGHHFCSSRQRVARQLLAERQYIVSFHTLRTVEDFPIGKRIVLNVI